MNEIDKDINKPFDKSTYLNWMNLKAENSNHFNTAEKLKIRSLERKKNMAVIMLC